MKLQGAQRQHTQLLIAPIVVVAFWLWLPLSASAQIVLNQVDTFSGGTLANWMHGAPSPNPPVNISTGGPMGVGDSYLQVTSNGVGGAGSRMIVINQSQWTGDYNSAGVLQITADMANFGATPLHMRVAMRGSGFSQYGSTNAFVLPADSIWRSVTFDLSTSGMTNIGGTDSLNTVLGSVIDFRILSAQLGPSFTGDTIAGLMGIDNIRAVGVPEPSSMILCAVGLGLGYRRWRRRNSPKSVQSTVK